MTRARRCGCAPHVNAVGSREPGRAAQDLEAAPPGDLGILLQTQPAHHPVFGGDERREVESCDVATASKG